MKIKPIIDSSESIVSIFFLGEHWNAMPDYQEAIPVGKKSWHSIKDAFYENNSHDKPLLMDIRKNDGVLTSVYIYGFRIVDTQLDLCFGNTYALCKLTSTDECIAILW
jgi:hypothetical protein